ncbi:MAG TPA: hypothetical protein VMR77_03385 [Patescibacteria group bacterium]|nr:hypothetical protein [Patescibacteria group bacterium]
MKNIFAGSFKNATNLVHVKKELIFILESLAKLPKTTRIGYVSGIVSSDGDHKLAENIQILLVHTEKLRNLLDFPVFSTADVITKELYDRFDETKLEREKREKCFRSFWCEVIEQGGVTDIFMTPRWELSNGATAEHQTTRELGLKIHYVK